MAGLFSYSVGDRVSRGGTIKAAAYLSRACYEDQKTGWRHDFTENRSAIHEASDHIARSGRHADLGSKQEVLFLGLYGPENAPDRLIGAANIEGAWNAAEAAERRRDAQVAERFRIALPAAVSVEQARWAIQDHVREFTREGRLVQVAIHSAEPGHDERNLHAHLLVSSRGVDENGFKALKAAEQQDRYLHRSQYVEHLRENWARVANRHLERHGHEAGLDHRSYRRQGIDREPTLHMGPGDADRERRGQRTDVGDHNRGVQARNARRGLITDRERLAQLYRDRYADQDMMGRPKTAEQVSRQLNGPAITAAEKERFKLLKDAGANKKAREETLWQSRLAQSSINERRENMGSARQWLHDHGVWRDPEITKREEAIKRAAKEHAKLSKAMKVLSPKIDRATSAVDAAFAQVRRPAEKELAALQEIGQRARTRLEPHLEAERERREQERQAERQGQRRGYGISR